MSRNLSNFLNRPFTTVELAVKRLESMSGYSSTDVRLLADVNTTVRNVCVWLGLDPNDTSPKEIYHALQVKLNTDENRLAAQLKVKGDVEPSEFCEAVLNYLRENLELPQIYSLKKTIAKEFIKNNPPKKLMKALNYRSVDSLIKRENICHILFAAQITESDRWNNTFWKRISGSKASDFESSQVELSNLPIKFQKVLNSKHHVLENQEYLGSIIVVPNRTAKKLGVIGLCMLIAGNVAKQQQFNALAKVKSLNPDFGKSIAGFMKEGHGSVFNFTHMPVPWKTMFHHFGTNSEDEYSELFGPHVLSDDLIQSQPAKMLSGISQVFNWWSKLEYTGLHTDKTPLSFNIMDVLSNKLNGREFGQHRSSHLHESLWHELISRYLKHPGVKAHFVDKLFSKEELFDSSRLSFEPVNVSEEFEAANV